MKVRVSLSLDSKLVNEIDSHVDGIITRSRSDAVEKILKQYVAGEKTAVVLAGGGPEKLLIRGLDVFRPLAKIDKRRLIEDIILKCRSAGFRNVIIVGFSILISKLYEILGDGKKYDVNITYVEENKELGSAKTLELAKKYVTGDILFLPCDHYFDFDLKKLYEFHQLQNGTVTLGIHARTSFDWKTSVVVMDGYKIIDYEESPKTPKTHLISIFIGFMKSDIFNFIPPGDVYWSLQKNLFPKLAKEGKLVGYPIAGNWVNVHSKEDIEKVIELDREKSK
jgi:NDP-sugar pyrophosphorylase family protein